MSIKTIQLVQDDFDGSEGAQTVPFSFDGQNYEIDLNDEHTQQLRDALQPFIDRARRARGGRSSASLGRRVAASPGTSARGRTSLSGKPFSAKEVREWAHANGVDVSAQGRVPEAVIEQYEAALTSAVETSAPKKRTPAKKATTRKAAAKKAPAKASSRRAEKAEEVPVEV